MQSSAPASLSNLNDIVMPATISWWPLAPGWYALMAILCLFVFWAGWRYWQHWHHNLYRRQALLELAEIHSELNSTGKLTALIKLPALLKRTALAAYPRKQIIGFNTEDWFAFLNTSTPTPVFNPGLICDLKTIAYASKNQDALLNIASAPLLESVENWIRQHNLNVQVITGGGD